MAVTLACGATIAEPGDTPGSLINAPRQIEFGGLLTGSGTPYRWKQLTGWDDQTAYDLSDASKDTGHGDYPGPGFSQARFVTYDLTVQGDTPALMEEAITTLIRRFRYRDAEEPLHIRDTGRHLVVDARVIARGVPHTPMRTVGVLDLSVQWKATEPLRRSPTTRTQRLVAGVASGGKVYPKVFPVDWGVAAVGGSRTLTNAGDDPAPATVTFNGPGTGHAVAIGGMLMRSDLPLVAGDRLVVDTRDGSVVLNGSTDRSSWISTASTSPEEWRIPPGEESCTFTVAAGAGAGTSVDLEWADTSM